MTMANRELVEYVKSALSSNTPRDQIRKALARQGWPQHDVDEAVGQALLELRHHHDSSLRFWMVAAVFLALLLVILLVLPLFGITPVPQISGPIWSVIEGFTEKPLRALNETLSANGTHG